MSSKPGILLNAAELGLGLLLFAAFLSVRDLPLVDLPQHTLQLANWLRIDAGDPSVANLELNFRTPYLLAYPIARVMAPFVLALPALKLVLAACVVAQAVTLRKLCTAFGHDPWLGLLGFPLGLGYSFCFGFVSFCAAIPIVHLTFICAATHRARPTARSGLHLALLSMLLLIAHGVALGFTLLVLGPLLVRGGGRLWQRALPLLSAPALAVLWLVPGGSSTRLGADLWRFEPARALELPGQLAGIGPADSAATAAGSAILAVLALRLGRPREAWLFVPLVLALLGYFFFPTMFRGAGPLGPRFAIYLVPALLLAVAPRASRRSFDITLRSLTALLAAAVPLLFCSRLHAFNRESADFHELTRDLPPGLRMRPLVFDRTGPAFPGVPAHLHFPAYYSVEKGGHPGYSFAMYAISVVRWRPGIPIKMGGGAEWAPERFDAAREAEDYDYFLVRSTKDRTATLFGNASVAVLDRRVGAWWGYRRATSTPTAGQQPRR